MGSCAINVPFDVIPFFAANDRTTIPSAVRVAPDVA